MADGAPFFLERRDVLFVLEGDRRALQLTEDIRPRDDDHVWSRQPDLLTLRPEISDPTHREQAQDYNCQQVANYSVHSILALFS
jgi:hypothetical protein